MGEFESFIGESVLAEMAATPDVAKREWLETLAKGISVLPLTIEAEEVAEEYVKHGAVPRRFRGDALHIAIIW